MIAASREILAPRPDVWRLVAEPYHLPDWWPAYTGVRPDRLGFARNARWRVSRSRSPGFLRKPQGDGLIVITEVVDGLELRWHDLEQRIDAGVALSNAGDEKTLATAFVDGSWWRLTVEGARHLPSRAVTRLHDLCQTAASL